MFVPQSTRDGSFTFFSAEFNEAFHSHFGAKQEARQKFVEPCQICDRAKERDSFQILDICYGLGYNTAAALAAIRAVNPDCRVEVIGLESNLEVPRQAIDRELLQEWESPIPELLGELASTLCARTESLQARLLIGDARQTIRLVLESGFQADAVFLDPFSPPKCPQLWTVEFLSLVAKCLKPTGRLATYSCAASVRTALSLAGLEFGPTPSVGRRSPGTVACFDRSRLEPLSPREREHLSTRAAVPLRDPDLQNPAPVILARRQTEQQSSFLEPTSRWKERWRELSENQ